MKKRSIIQDMSDFCRRNQRNINYVFLGVGLCLLVMNITAFLGFVADLSYAKLSFNLSVFSSILVILVSINDLTYMD